MAETLTNEELRRIVRLYGLTVRELIELTGRSRTLCYGWMYPKSSPHHKTMSDLDLRLVKLELGLVKPKWCGGAKK